jgi:hypothetical protein
MTDENKKRKALEELDVLLRHIPDKTYLMMGMVDPTDWLARAGAALRAAGNPTLITDFRMSSDALASCFDRWEAEPHYAKIRRSVSQAMHELRLDLTGPTNEVIGEGGVWRYFDHIRKIVEGAQQDVLFVDQYLDAEFVSRYLPHVPQSAAIRLLTGSSKLKKLVPAASMFAKENSVSLEIRSSKKPHDRFVIVDRTGCYQSGASIKDGASISPTIITEFTDARDSIIATYEQIWSEATPVDLK